MKTVTVGISLDALAALADGRFGDLVKAVTDLGRGIMVVDADMHADEEAVLLDDGSLQADLWGINLYPQRFGTPDFIEFDSMINVRPRQGNRSRAVENAADREAIAALVARLVTT